MDLNLQGKVVIVTGAARGIGRATALTFCREGAYVVIDDIDLQTAKLVAEEASTLGGRAIAIRADVTKLDEVKRMVSKTLESFGGIDILINNAGIWYIDGQPVGHQLFDKSTVDYWNGELNITLFGVLNCTKTVLDIMQRQKGGSIINIASDAAQGPQRPRITVYGAGKGGILAFTKNLAYEVGPSGIRVNCIAPGLIKTSRAQIMESGSNISPEAASFWQNNLAQVGQLPLGRMGMPQEIANVVVFVASDVGSYITGQTITVNGGHFMA